MLCLAMLGFKIVPKKYHTSPACIYRNASRSSQELINNNPAVYIPESLALVAAAGLDFDIVVAFGVL